MQRTSRSGAKKKAAIVVALLAILAIGVSGTFAWQDYRQHRSNELAGIGLKYEVRLVEDFEEVPDWKVEDGNIKKEIRVTNLGQAAAGYGAVYVRLQLKEFMQIGDITYVESERRYMIDTEGQFVIYTSEAAARADWPNHNVAQLRDIVTGRSGWFIETQAGDLHGQYGKHVLLDILVGEAEPVIPGSVFVPEADRNHHGFIDSEGNFVTRSGECDYPIHGWGAIDATSAIDRYVEWVLGADVIRLSDWDDEPVRAWIIDDTNGDGWAYWGQALATDGDTTSNLLEAVRLIEQPDGSFYYVIHTDMEALSIDEFLNGDGQNWDARVRESYWNNRPRIEISGNATTVKERESVQPPSSITVLPAGAAQSPIRWSSSNPSIATVDVNTGVVTGVNAGGPVTIIARAPNGARGQYSLMVTLGDPVEIPVTGIQLNASSRSMNSGNEFQLVATISPANADDQSVTWISSDPSIATVDENGLVTAIAVGTATITVTTNDGGHTATCAITVTAATFPATGVTIDGGNQTIVEGETYTPGYTATPANTTDTPTWSSSNPAVASVNEATGEITAIASGEATITVTLRPTGVTNSITITVVADETPATGVTIDTASPMEIIVGQTLPINYTVTPSDSTDTAALTSNNDNVTIVSNNSIRGVTPGTSIVTVRLNSTTSAQITVNVVPAEDPPLPTLNGEGPYGMVGHDNINLSYSIVKIWHINDFNTIFVDDQDGSIKLSDILPAGFDTSNLSISSSDPVVNANIRLGRDKRGDDAIMISYLGTPEQWLAVNPEGSTTIVAPEVQIRITLSAPGFADTDILVDLQYHGSMVIFPW